MIKHRTPNSGQMRLTAVYWSHTLRLGEEDIPHHLGPRRLYLRGVNKQEWWEAGSRLTSGWGAPRFLQESVTGLFEKFHRSAGNHAARPRWSAAGPAGRGTGCVRGLSFWAGGMSGGRRRTVRALGPYDPCQGSKWNARYYNNGHSTRKKKDDYILPVEKI